MLGHYFGVEFDISCVIATPGNPVITDTLKGCIITSVDKSSSSGSDARMITLPLNVSDILYNGKSVIDDSEAWEVRGAALANNLVNIL
jgi:hypothetical protein